MSLLANWVINDGMVIALTGGPWGTFAQVEATVEACRRAMELCATPLRAIDCLAARRTEESMFADELKIVDEKVE